MTRKTYPKGIFFFLCTLIWLPAISQTDSVTYTRKIYKSIDSTALYVDQFQLSEHLIAKKPAIIFFHGGGWAFGNPSEFHGACKRYAALGFVTFSFQYRLSIDEEGKAPHPDITPIECVKDARSAVRWVRENHETLGVNPDQIVVGGQSVGGQLTLMTYLADSINEETDNMNISSKPNLMLLYSSTVNTIEAWCDLMLGDKRQMIWDISPHHNIKKGMPPALHFHGLDDHIVKFWTVDLFRREMEKLGNEYQVVTYEGRSHYLGEGNEKYARLFDEEIMERTDEFLIQQGYLKIGK